jgi:hypothetical protein
MFIQSDDLSIMLFPSMSTEKPKVITTPEAQNGLMTSIVQLLSLRTKFTSSA